MSALEEVHVEQIIADIKAERGVIENAGACWVRFSEDTEICYRGLDANACSELQLRGRLKTTFYHQRFCP